jgi:hypothetical protein
MTTTHIHAAAQLDPILDVETRYLDLDGDGVPDAVQIIETVSVDATGDGHPDFVELVEELVTDIGVDGKPGAVDVLGRAVIELDHAEHERTLAPRPRRSGRLVT